MSIEYSAEIIVGLPRGEMEEFGELIDEDYLVQDIQEAKRKFLGITGKSGNVYLSTKGS